MNDNLIISIRFILLIIFIVCCINFGFLISLLFAVCLAFLVFLGCVILSTEGGRILTGLVVGILILYVWKVIL